MTDGEATPKLAFLIAGMARSGTTLVQRMASELESVWVPAETHFWRYAATLASKYSWPLDRSLVEEAIGWLRSRESFPKAHFETGRALDALTDEIFLWDLFQAVVIGLSPPDAEILGEKTPDHLLWAEHLLDSKPDLRVIAVIRDPREVLRSQRSVPWGIHDPAAFTEKWLHLARCIEDCRRLFPDRVLAIKYEDAARVPEETRKEIAQFVGVSTAIEDVTNRRYSLFPESEWWKHHSVDPIEPQADTWQDLLSPSDVEIIESRAAETMQVWGYVPVSTPRDSGMTAAARQMRIALRRASSQVLPVTSAQLDAWNATDTARATRWEERARELQLDLRGERTARKALEGWQRQAEELRRTLTHLREINEATVQRLNESERAVSAWKVRASEMQRAHQRSELQRLRAELRYRKTAGQLRRLRARRWWRLAGVLSRWRHAPWRVLTLFREGWNTVFGPSELPNPPDVRTIAARIERLEKQLALAPQQGLEAARRAFSSGEYERALELINESPEDIRTSVEALTLANGCYVRMGELSQGLKVMRALLRVKNDRKLEWQARFQEGRLIETDPRWLPDVGMPKSDEAIVPRPQTVLHILKESLPYFERGYTMRSHSTLLAQRQAGFEPSVVTSLGFPRAQGFEEFPPREDIDGIPHYRLDLGPSYPLSAVPFDQLLSDQAMLTAQLSRELKPALIQAGSGYRGYETALVGLAVARYLDLPMIYEIRSFLEHTWTGELSRAEEGEYYHRRFEQEIRCLSEADHVITIAESMRDELIGRGISAEKVSVVPNVVDIDRFRPRPKSLELQRRYGLEGSLTIGYISNLGFREGIDNLIRAVGLLRANGLDVKGLVVGDGPEREALEALVEELDLGGQVVLTGHIPNAEIEDHYALIDLFVIPRIDDRAARLVTPLKPLEAMAMNIPIIAADLPALRELVAPGKRGEVFRPSDPEHLAEVAAELLANETKRMEYATAGRDWVASERTLEANARRYKEILQGVLGGQA